jgi:hypothetical protein
MNKLTAFVQEHIGDDLTRLILDRKKWPDIDLDLAVSCIQSRRKLKDKVHDWYMNPELIFPVSLSAEQCSSTATGIYKAELALKTLKAAMPEAEYHIYPLSPAFITQGGPGCVAVQYNHL